jgi:hypothetical protein
MASGNGGEDDLEKNCGGFKHDLQDALDHLNAISESPNLPKDLADLAGHLGKMLRDVENYAEKHRAFFIDAESLPKRP